jgi:hypothetical protein
VFAGPHPQAVHTGDAMTPQTYDEILETLRELANEDILSLNRAILQVMLERDLANGAFEEALAKSEGSS